jgi:2-polyprenyl-3-methyl-5-hydroxy-6-metoxy-1,4-benzoquinol methylase
MSTREPQYSELLELREKYGNTRLGLAAEISWFEDPKRLSFVLARYKFVSKMFKGFSKIAEIGCGDGFASRIVAHEVESYLGLDFDPIFISTARTDLPKYEKRMSFMEYDVLEGPLPGGKYDGIFSCDVLEHIERKREHFFFLNISKSLTENGVLIIGTPSLASQAYASPRSKAGHVNCKNGDELRTTCLTYFSNVFLFGMNDEVIHTGHMEMCHYYFAICTNPRPTSED